VTWPPATPDTPKGHWHRAQTDENIAASDYSSASFDVERAAEAGPISPPSSETTPEETGGAFGESDVATVTS
jgi:hypothetical protein